LNYKINNGNRATYVFFKSGTVEPFTVLYQLRLFTISRGSVHDRLSYIKMYYFQLYDNGTLIRDYIPARRNSDGVVGMYDVANQVFYTSPNGANFVAGPVVQ